jgi:sigma-B regulation protein RsbU (phosphoserine phosphatase)
MTLDPAAMSEMLDTAPCGFVAFTDDGRIMTANRTLLDLLSYSADAIVGQKFERMLTVASRIFYQTHFFPLIKLHGKVDEVFLSLRTLGGEDVPMLVNAVRKEQDSTFLNHCVLVPVYQRRKYEDEILLAKRAAEEALKSNDELNRIRGELEQHTQELDRKLSRLEQKHQELAQVSHLLSHDLREPIRKIAWFAEVLRDENDHLLTATGKETLERIHATCKTADQRLHVLRDFVSLDVVDEALENVDLNEVVTSALRQACEATGVMDVRLERDTLPPIEGFRRQLLLLFRHLIENTVKFQQPGASPLIHLRSSIVQQNSFRVMQGKYRYIDVVKLGFRDNSTGFDGKHHEHVFNVLTNVKTFASGPGLGLAACRKVVENHHGLISVVSEPGKGVAYTITLPLKQ